MPWHLPEDREQSLALLDLTTGVIQEHQVQIVDTGYLVPYGIVGHLAKISTGVHHVMRHGGSDLEKFLKRKILETVLREALSKADAVITDSQHKGLFEPMAAYLVCQPPYVVDTAVFRPRDDNQRPRWRLASIGKINYHWQHKGLQPVAEIMSTLKDRFECWIVGQGNGMLDFQRSLSQKVSSSIHWRPFVPPWEMPSLLNQLDAIFIFESGLPHPLISNLAAEAMCCGIGIITDRPDFAQTYRGLVTTDASQVLLVSPSEPSSASEMIAQWVAQRANKRQPSCQLVSYEEYISANEAVYEEVLSRHC
jgi:glycosyltransferase involved in cell wall biosynthesis